MPNPNTADREPPSRLVIALVTATATASLVMLTAVAPLTGTTALFIGLTAILILLAEQNMARAALDNTEYSARQFMVAVAVGGGLGICFTTAVLLLS